MIAKLGVVACVLVLALAACAKSEAPAEPVAEAALNTLSAEEEAEGWRLLFDGATTNGWRTFNSAAINPQWTVEDGALTLTAGGGGDIVTVDEYQNFELQLEWRIAEAGNSGIFFNVVEDPRYDTVWRTGPEIQILDDARHSDGADPTHRAGANYDLHAREIKSLV